MKELKPASSRVPEIPLSHGRSLAIQRDPSDADHVQLRSATGEIELSIILTASGPLLRVRAVDIELVAENRLSMECAELDLNVHGAASVRAEGALALRGEDVVIEADHGEIALRANDDIKLKGERIQLNCDDPPMPASWEEFEARTSSPRVD